MASQTTRDVLEIHTAEVVSQTEVLLVCKSRNLVMLTLSEEKITKQVLAPFCASKQIELIVPHGEDHQISLVSTFSLQVISYSPDAQFKKHGSIGTAPPGSNTKPTPPSVFKMSNFSAQKYPICLRQIEYPARHSKNSIKL